MMKLGFLASHNGSSMRAIVRAARAGTLAADPVIAISNNAGAGALEFAGDAGMATRHLSAMVCGDATSADAAIGETLQAAAVDLVVLSGYMRKLGGHTLAAFDGRILNVHPALLPKFGGAGMYGRHVHEAVLKSGDPVSGATIHLVDDEYDHGRVLAQEQVPVLPGDTVADLSARVGAIEPALYVMTLQRIISGELFLPRIDPTTKQP